ncbi:MAG: hypothetical protein HY609_07020 [Deltaproteobacteria bacterium]|nr:hypothetical protein [Deltaproteobacteria bacterium]MBI4224671.1 hypothetical protein [Deltaproteobacteria bacterium]
MDITLPTEAHLARIYFELGRAGARAVGEKKPWPYHIENREALLTLAADWSRFDPRLLEILVQYGGRAWETLQPQKLRQNLAAMESPQALGVIAAFIQTADPLARERNLFWDYVVKGLRPVEAQFYFRDLYPLGSRLAQRAARESLAEFKRWGFLGLSRIVIDPATRQAAGTWDQESRHNILKRLFREKGTLQISDYLKEIEQTLSRQQALLDLKSLKAKQKGKGRSAHWILRPAPRGSG